MPYVLVAILAAGLVAAGLVIVVWAPRLVDRGDGRTVDTGPHWFRRGYPWYRSDPVFGPLWYWGNVVAYWFVGAILIGMGGMWLYVSLGEILR